MQGWNTSGGFMDSPSKGGGGGGGVPSSQDDHVQTLTPVTLLQLAQAKPKGGGGEEFLVDDQLVTQVTIVGRIIRVEHQETNLNIVVNDGTSEMSIRIWQENSQDDIEWREGMYVRAFGHLQAFSDNRHLLAFRLRPIEDENEITCHLSECIFVHLYHTTGKQRLLTPDGVDPTQPQAQSGTRSTSTGGGAAVSTYQAPGAVNAGLSELQSAVLNIIRQSASAEGPSVADMVQALTGVAGEAEIRTAVEQLTSEGHVYSTVDDDHFKDAQSF